MLPPFQFWDYNRSCCTFVKNYPVSAGQVGRNFFAAHFARGSSKPDMTYGVLEVDPRSIEDIEQLGSKPKFWFYRGEERWLFKEARGNTGEDWAEKVAAEIAPLIGVEAARVELAVARGKLGSATFNFVDSNAGEVLVHGNELLAGHVLGYDKLKKQRQSDHTLENIRTAVQKVFREEDAEAILETLAGYAVLDAVIGNTDRHHENWGVLFSLELAVQAGRVRVAPSFDHASSLGRELLDSAREKHLESGTIRRYMKGGHGGIYISQDEKRGANPFDLVRFGVLRFPQYFIPSVKRAALIDMTAVAKIFDNMPVDRISPHARRFALEMIQLSVNELRGALK